MPKKRDDEAAKQAIAEKVKQIQSKQARWMQQRKEQLDRGGGRQQTQTGQTGGSTRGTGNRKDKKPAAQSTRSRSSRARAMLSPDMFDALADQIANRLKVRMDKPTSIEDTGGGGHVSQESSIDTHKCQVCSSLMVPPDHRPMLVIPCGHTFCTACVRHTDTCPGCGQEVSSLTCNIMLQQIIVENKNKRKPKTREHSNIHISSANHTYAPQKYSGGTSRFDSLSEKNKTAPSSVKKRDSGYRGDGKHKSYHGNRGEDYVEKYHTLTMRCEVLETEADGIKEKMETVAKQLEREQKQVAGIEKQEESLREQIKMLEEKINSLQSHKEGYIDTCDELEGQHFNLASKLSMVEDTLQSLTLERDKVRILAHNFDPSINIEDD
ncbi:Hypp5597 [Branchiostoma lanceolatum]|uniref:Hypp5597 protein n=1 Tax=Branchiostoma lanceolatum TaxID=7740 RepID=A0A8J9YS54_BRALA|nr:Hypp5597 [Branchiostoma lanceolatum]